LCPIRVGLAIAEKSKSHPTHGELLMKSILVLVGGGDRDHVICQTALAAARPLSGHLDFLHVHVSPGHAARYNHAEFARGPALRNALEQLGSDAKTYSEVAADNVRDFCARSMIEFCDAPTGMDRVSASFREETDSGAERLAIHARHSDLIVMGRAKQRQGLAPDILERLVLSCGRPMLVAASAAPEKLTGTIMVCWNESNNAARAVAAATPLLAKAKRVVFTSVMEHDESIKEAICDLARRFAWNGVAVETRMISAKGLGIPGALAAAGKECGADLLVMGAFGQSRAHALFFGSCTEAFLRSRQADFAHALDPRG
jgi:nucleotide-binding universal stress UspA family protein